MGELQSLRGELSNLLEEGKAERDLHRQSVLSPGTPQPDMLVCWGGWGLGAEAQGFGFGGQTQGEDWGWLCGGG